MRIGKEYKIPAGINPQNRDAPGKLDIFISDDIISISLIVVILYSGE
jgi:hypothetical protein